MGPGAQNARDQEGVVLQIGLNPRPANWCSTHLHNLVLSVQQGDSTEHMHAVPGWCQPVTHLHMCVHTTHFAHPHQRNDGENCGHLQEKQPQLQLKCRLLDAPLAPTGEQCTNKEGLRQNWTKMDAGRQAGMQAVWL